MDLQRILSQLHDERRLVNEVIVVLERLGAGIQHRGNLARAAAKASNQMKDEATPVLKKKRGRPRKNPVI